MAATAKHTMPVCVLVNYSNFTLSLRRRELGFMIDLTPPAVKATAPGRSGTASPRQLRYSIDARRALSWCLALISTGVALMFMLLMSLLIIAIAVVWHFSCGGEAAACQITRSFSWGAGLLGLLCLAMAVLAFAEDWKNSGRRKTPSQSEDEGLQ